MVLEKGDEVLKGRDPSKLSDDDRRLFIAKKTKQMDKVGALYRLSAEDGRLPEFDLAGAASFAKANRWSGPLKFIYSGKYSKPRQTRSDQGYLSTFGGTADGNELIRGQTYFYNPHNGKVYSSLEAYNGKTSSVSKPSKPIDPPKEMRAETVTAEEIGRAHV